MDCNNEFCTWCTFGLCCHESEEGHKNAKPNMLDCPSSLRSDHLEQMCNSYSRLMLELHHLNFGELLAVERYIKGLKER